MIEYLDAKRVLSCEVESSTKLETCSEGTMGSKKYGRKHFHEGRERAPNDKMLAGEPDYKARHRSAMSTVTVPQVVSCPKRQHEIALAAMVKGLAAYADAYRSTYSDGLASDYVLGEYWETIAHALRGLLNGEIGRLDGGLTYKAICDALESAGFNPDVHEKL